MEVANMRLLNANINCFGGTDNHREEYKKLYGNRKYLNIWDQIDKEDISVMGDCVIASKTMNINSLKVSRHNNTYTDHQIIIVDVN